MSEYFHPRKVRKGAGRYIRGDAPPFDQKNEMFKRPFWDPEMRDLFQRFYRDKVPPKNKPGYRLKDQAMVNAAWHLESHFGCGVCGGRAGLYDWSWNGHFDFPRVPKGLKIPTDNPRMITRDVKKVAGFFGASLVGVCRLDRRWLYSKAYLLTPEGGKIAENEIPPEYENVIILGFEMDYKAMCCSPAHPASATVGLEYSRMAFVAGLLAQYIRGLGFKAIPCGNDTACSIPLAIDAGLGELGRNGLLITPQYGPRVRLAKVFTDLPLVADQPIAFGVWEFCLQCGRCAESCPSQSIMSEEPSTKTHNISNRENVHAWHINAEKCLDFWARNGTDCSTCIRVCPFNKPEGVIHDLARWAIMTMRPLHKVFLRVDALLGYGKKESSEKFWGHR